METVKQIDDWFQKFENGLKEIFEDETLELQFDKKNYNFNIILQNRENFDFNTLLENRLLIDDMSGLSYDGIVESYFNSDKYSQIVKEKINEYESLSNKDNPSPDEKEKLLELKIFFT
ncbi:MAG: hypothetical protein GY754_08525 [bacterium]|nr:hypothetical protein [bacterium]